MKSHKIDWLNFFYWLFGESPHVRMSEKGWEVRNNKELSRKIVLEKNGVSADDIEELLEAIEKDEWISVEDRLPETNENVFVVDNGRLGVMSYGLIEADENSGYAWSNCYGDIHGDPEYDDEYKPTHWRELPNPPKQ